MGAVQEPLPIDGTGELHPNPEDTLTPADLGLDLRVTQPDPAWLQHRACTPASLHPELTTETWEYARDHGGRWFPGVSRGLKDDAEAWWIPTGATRARESYTDDVRQAKAECLACPVMTQCRASAVYVRDFSGVAGGWTETQRDAYRTHHGIPAPDDGLDRTDPSGLCLAVLNEVKALSEAGVDAGRIADYFDSPEIDQTTVDYARQILAGSKTPAWATPNRTTDQKGAAA